MRPERRRSMLQKKYSTAIISGIKRRVEMEFYQKLYVGESLDKKQDKIIEKLKAGKIQLGCYVIAVTEHPNSQLEFLIRFCCGRLFTGEKSFWSSALRAAMRRRCLSCRVFWRRRTVREGIRTSVLTFLTGGRNWKKAGNRCRCYIFYG